MRRETIVGPFVVVQFEVVGPTSAYLTVHQFQEFLTFESSSFPSLLIKPEQLLVTLSYQCRS